MHYKYCTLIIFTLITVSCATIKDKTLNQQLLISKCNQQKEYKYSEKDFPLPLDQLSEEISLLNQKISYNSLFIANTIGIIKELDEYIKIRSTPKHTQSISERIRMLELRQEIDHKINNASLVISAVTAELDCEEERVSQIANYLSEKQSSMESKLTIGAIIVGASGAILTGGVIKNNSVSNTVGISTGVAEAALGLTMLFNKRKIEFFHNRNALKEIWEGPKTSPLFPSFIWYYLNMEENAQPSIRQEIVEKWAQFGQISSQDSTLINLYFGTGGKYTSDQLDNRADMYDQLESQIYLLKQKLMALSNEIDNI